MIQITKAQLKPIETRIIVVTYESGVTKWFPFTLENREIIISEHHNIFDMQIVKRARLNQDGESNKLILVIYGSGLTTYFTNTLENLEIVISDHSLIEHMEIVERG